MHCCITRIPFHSFLEKGVGKGVIVYKFVIVIRKLLP